MNSKVLFNDGWEFAKSGLGQKDWQQLQFQAVDLPHDWLIENSLDLYADSLGWYRKRYPHRGHFEQVLLYFEGVYMDSTLYVNGQEMGQWKYGYSSFELDMTAALQLGENEIVLKVTHQHPNSRWYSGAGIYRHVWLLERSRTHIVTGGIYVSAAKSEGAWQVTIDTELSLRRPVKLTHTILKNGVTIVRGSATIPAAATLDQQVLKMENPLLWSVQAPNLYQLQTDLALQVGSRWRILQTEVQQIGLRAVKMDPKKGLFINGQRVILRGVADHHDLGALGAAFHKDALRRRLRLLKKMGVNALRTAHNMPAPALMDLADEMGFLVLSEAFDVWEQAKTKYDYSRFFQEWARRDVRSWVRRDRNHPSLIMWSLGNEIHDTNSHRGYLTAKKLRGYVLEDDPRQNGQITLASNYMGGEAAQKCAQLVQAVGYNYGERYYHQHHGQYPRWVMLGSEVLSIAQSRGIYHFPFQKAILADDDQQCSALGNSPTSWGAPSVEEALAAHRDAPFVLGQFIWSGFDYLGEPVPYATKNAYLGQIDTAGFPKDSYYIFKAAWTDYGQVPFVHIFPYWDFNPGQLIDVRVASNAPLIELRLNGTPLGTHRINFQQGTDFVGWWQIPYTKGELQAFAYDQAGRLIASHSRKSFGDAQKILLRADRQVIAANGTDLIFVEVSVQDKQGNPVENASNRVQIVVRGEGRLIGLDNGDSTDYDQYKGQSRRLFSGKLVAIIAATLNPGEFIIKADSIGLEGASLHFRSLPADQSRLGGVSASTQNRKRPIVTGQQNEVPVRKLEIVSSGGRKLGPSKRELFLQAQIYPAAASYREIEWSVVHDGGAPSHLAKIEAQGKGALLTALGDGQFRVRAASKNGTDKIRLFSELEFVASGLGPAYKDPYQLILASLYDDKQGELAPGLDKGITTGEQTRTELGFQGLDFGHYGSDRLTIPIFARRNERYTLEIWEGAPGQTGSGLLKKAIYKKAPIWRRYQAETYALPRRLKGVTSLYFVAYDKLEIQGFVFEKQKRAFTRNKALHYDAIYGQDFVETKEGLQAIGNNVSVVFYDFDFGQKGAGALEICARAPSDHFLHLLFEQEGEKQIQGLAFRKTKHYQRQRFALDRIRGRQTVTFLFLPGSNFDFAWFRFKAD